MRRAALSTLALFATAGTVATVAGAQPSPTPRLAPAVAPIALDPITVAPSLAQALKNKRTFDASKVPLSHRGATPVLKVKSGRSYQLLPNNDPLPARLATTPVAPAEIEKLRPTFARWRPGVRPSFEFSDTPTNHIPTQTPIKDQGPRGTCVAFSNMAGMEAFVKRHQNRTIDLSENHAFELFMQVGNGVCDPDKGVGLKSMLTLQTHGVCAESLFPYTNACPGSVPSACANSNDRLRITGLFPLSFPDDPLANVFSADNTAVLEAIIHAGLDIEYSIKVAGSDWSDGTAESGVIDVQVDGKGNPVGPYANHGILLVGYNHAAGYFVFKNSWGADWGHSGYGHVSYDYIETYARYGYAITNVGH